MNSDGSGLVQLTDNGVDDVNPFWSPDGQYLAFSHQHPNNANIYTTSPERPLLLSLTDHPADDSGGSWATRPRKSTPAVAPSLFDFPLTTDTVCGIVQSQPCRR
jgi:hypothetical protein